MKKRLFIPVLLVIMFVCAGCPISMGPVTFIQLNICNNTSEVVTCYCKYGTDSISEFSGIDLYKITKAEIGSGETIGMARVADLLEYDNLLDELLVVNQSNDTLLYCVGKEWHDRLVREKFYVELYQKRKIHQGDLLINHYTIEVNEK